MPRAYRMGERAAQLAATRERIVEAAIALYTEQGISATTLRQIGERADVAPGTLRNHFPSRESLGTAMVERLQAEGPLPELSIYDGADTIEARLGRLVRVTGAFFDGRPVVSHVAPRADADRPMGGGRRGVWRQVGSAHADGARAAGRR